MRYIAVFIAAALGFAVFTAVKGLGIRLRYGGGRLKLFIYIAGINLPLHTKKRSKRKRGINGIRIIRLLINSARIRRLYIKAEIGFADSAALTALAAGAAGTAANALHAAFAAGISEKRIAVAPAFGRDAAKADADCIIIIGAGKLMKAIIKKGGLKT